MASSTMQHLFCSSSSLQSPRKVQRKSILPVNSVPLSVSGRPSSPVVVCSAAASEQQPTVVQVSRREVTLLAALVASSVGSVGAARADAEEDYKRETLDVIEQVKTTLSLEKSDPNKVAAVAKLRTAGNEWVAKYRKSKKVAGKPSFSNMYSVVNAISGHFVSFGATYPIPAKRKDRILDEVKDAEKALSRGR